ncbi:MAG TPA: ATP-binding protein [Rhodocyclaceae bacterium]
MKLSPFAKRLVFVVTGLNLFAAAMIVAWLVHSLAQNRVDARRNVDNLAQVLQASLTGVIRHIDLALLTVADEYRHAERVDAKTINELFTRQLGHLPEIESLRATDANGNVYYGVGANARTNLADRDFFIAARDRPDAGLIVGKPVFARIAKKWVIVFARRLETADARFAGVVYVNLALDRLSGEFAALDIGASGSASLRDGDLGVIVRVPESHPLEQIIGSRAVSPQLVELVRAGKSSGNYLAPTGFDQVERAAAFRRLDPYPLYVLIGIAEDDYLAVWRQEAYAAAAAMLLFALVTLSSAWLLLRAWHRQQEAAEELAHSRDELELRVGERTAQLAAANKELEEFSYSMSHDMRTPLRAIDGYATILLEDYRDRLDDEGRRLLRELSRNAGRMGHLIDDILRFLGMARRKVKYAVVDVAAVAGEVFAELSAADGRPVRFTVGPAPVAWADHDMVKLLLAELIGNSLKFASGDREPLIEVGGSEADGENRYYVRDNGVGFDMRYGDKLFKVFERLHGPGQYEGTGIGLAMAKRIAERHGGRVWAEGVEGRGATFRFSLPRPPG